MSAMYSSALAITSINAQGRRCDSVFDSASSEIELPPSTSAVVTMTRLPATMTASAAGISQTGSQPPLVRIASSTTSSAWTWAESSVSARCAQPGSGSLRARRGGRARNAV